MQPRTITPAVEAVLDQYGREYRELLRRIEDLRQQAARIKAIIEAAEKLAGIEPGSPESVLAGLAPTTRSGAVLMILREHGPIAIADLDGRLRELNRHESRKDIASTVSYLRSKGLARSVRRGVWTSAD